MHWKPETRKPRPRNPSSTSSTSSIVLQEREKPPLTQGSLVGTDRALRRNVYTTCQVLPAWYNATLLRADAPQWDHVALQSGTAGLPFRTRRRRCCQLFGFFAHARRSTAVPGCGSSAVFVVGFSRMLLRSSICTYCTYSTQTITPGRLGYIQHRKRRCAESPQRAMRLCRSMTASAPSGQDGINPIVPGVHAESEAWRLCDSGVGVWQEPLLRIRRPAHIHAFWLLAALLCRAQHVGSKRVWLRPLRNRDADRLGHRSFASLTLLHALFGRHSCLFLLPSPPSFA